MIKPLDIVLLVSMVGLKPDARTTFLQIAAELGSTTSTMNRSVNRLLTSGLLVKHRTGSLSPSDYSVNRRGLYEILVYAIRYLMPTTVGAPARGMTTAHSGPDLKPLIHAEIPYVWPYVDGTDFGPGIEPLDPSVPRVAASHPLFYRIMALTEACRVGRVRERKLAEDLLRALLLESRDDTRA